MYKRLLKNQIQEKFFKGKAIIIVGARQVGKTVLSLELLDNTKFRNNVKVFNCDNPTDREMLSNKNLEFLVQLVGNARVILIDEGQKVDNIGQTVKLLVDHYKNKKQILITGSSSFNLLDRVQETLTGRKYVFHLFSLSLEEIYSNKNYLAFLKQIETHLIYGSYPEIIKQETFEDKRELLKELSTSHLYKDVLEFQEIKHSNVIVNLLKALALQIGSEVSYNELANLIGIDKKTVEAYVDLLEKNYIIFRLHPYTKNKRREISKLKKIYFYDLGVRNTIINNFNLLIDRNDKGELWENFMIAERLKFQAYHKIYSNNYFWRTYDGAEVDLIEERDGKLYGYEFKWEIKNKKIKAPLKWQEYSNSSYEIISKENVIGFVM